MINDERTKLHSCAWADFTAGHRESLFCETEHAVLAASLADRDAIQMLQCFATIQHDKSVPPNMRSEVESKYLAILYTVTTTQTPFVRPRPRPHPQQLLAQRIFVS